MKNLFTYSIFGFFASAINVYVFNFFHLQLHKSLLIANTVSWFISNIFSFTFNKHIVFKNKTSSISMYIKEIRNFFTTRGFSWIIDMGIMTLGTYMFPNHSLIVKIVDQLLVGVLNYLLSKFIFVYANRKIIERIDQSDC